MESQFNLTFSIERVEGKFASRDEIEERLRDQLEQLDIDLSGLGADGVSEYELVDLVVDVADPRKKPVQR